MISPNLNPPHFPASSHAQKSIVLCLLGLIVLLGLALRVQGIHWGLPRADRFTPLYHDEYTVLHALSGMKPARGDFNPHYFTDPTFFYYQVGALLKAASFFHQADLQTRQRYYLQNPGRYARLYVIGRGAVVFYGIASIVLLFFLGRQLTHSDAGGLLAAMFYAVIPLSVISCHVMEVAVPVSFWIGTCVYCLLKSLHGRSVGWLLAGSLAAGAALSTKYTAAPLGLLILYSWWKLRANRGVIGRSFFLAILAFLIGTPYSLLDWPEFWRDLRGIFLGPPGTHPVQHFSFPVTLYPFLHFGYAVGIALSAAILVGLYVRRKSNSFILAALFCAPYFYLLARNGFHNTRYLNETMPLLLPFGAAAILALWKKSSPVGYGLGALWLLFCFSRGPYTLAINRSLAREPDPRDVASDWIISHIPAQATIGLEADAEFVMPGHIYMDYWRGKRYDSDMVAPPIYHYTLWDLARQKWSGSPPDYWIDTHFLYGSIVKDRSTQKTLRQALDQMRKGYREIAFFKRDIHWGIFHYRLPSYAGNDWRIFLSELTIYRKQTEDADAAYKDFYSRFPNSPHIYQALLHRAEALLRQGKPGRWEEINEIIAELQKRRSNDPAARDALSQLLRMMPGDDLSPKILTDKGKELFKKGDYQSARKYFSRAALSFPNDPDFPDDLYYQAECDRLLGHKPEADAAYRELVAKFPGHPRAVDARNRL